MDFITQLPSLIKGNDSIVVVVVKNDPCYTKHNMTQQKRML